MYYLIGNPLGHSWSVPIHRRIAGYDYALRQTPSCELDALMRSRAFSGLNVTIPYKQTVIPYCDELTDTAAKIGAVNTIYFKEGRMIGHNTDYAGFAYLAARAGIDFAGRQVYVLGSGGTSRTVCAVAADAGASGVTVVSRKGEFDYAALYAAPGEFVLVNTTPVGMYPNTGEAPVELSRLPGCLGVLDVVYNPLRTALIAEAQARGIPAAGGLPMLVAQAVRAAECFLGHPLPDGEIEHILADVARQSANLVLVGMPGCGKSTVGRALARATGRRMIDTDEEVVARAGMTIPELFAKQGEAAFRKLEREVVAEYSRERGLILSCGGGVVLNAENRRAVRQNGRVYRLIRPTELLETAGRPLSGGIERMRAMELERRPIYLAASDATVANTGTPEDAAAAILEDFIARAGEQRK